MKLWIRVDADAPDDPAVTELADVLGVDDAHAFGLCTRVWCRMAPHATSGQLDDVQDGTIERWAGWRGERGAFAAAFRARFVRDGAVLGWEDRQGALMTRRERDRERMHRVRERSATVREQSPNVRERGACARGPARAASSTRPGDPPTRAPRRRARTARGTPPRTRRAPRASPPTARSCRPARRPAAPTSRAAPCGTTPACRARTRARRPPRARRRAPSRPDRPARLRLPGSTVSYHAAARS